MRDICAGYIKTPVGGMTAMWNTKGKVVALSFRGGNAALPDWFTDEGEVVNSLRSQLGEYFIGDRKHFDISIELIGTDFQVKVWEELLKQPYGQLIKYSELAEKIGRPDAARAVGNAVRSNPICIIVPCHRVVPANGGIGNYAWGSEKKWYLLSIEGAVHA